MPARHVPRLLLLAAVALSTACSTTVVTGGEDPATPARVPPASPDPRVPDDAPTPRPGLVVGEVPATPIPLADGLALAACDGDSPEILCVVDADGAVLGTVLVGSGPAGGDAAWLEEETQAWADDVGADRRATCPDRDVATDWQSPVLVAGREGVRAGLRVRTSDGVVTDMTRSWRVVDGDTVAWLTVNAATVDACVPEVEHPLTPARLGDVVDALGDVAAGMQVPDAG